MSKLTKIRLELAKLLAEFGSVKTDKNILHWYSEEDLQAGMDVYFEVDGEYTPAEAGEYVTEDGKTIVVADGKVESIVDPVAEVDAAEDPNIETDGVEETETDAMDAIHREINELYEIVDKLVKKVAEIEGRNTEVEKKVEEMSSAPAADSVEVEIKKEDNKFDYFKGLNK